MTTRRTSPPHPPPITPPQRVKKKKKSQPQSTRVKIYQMFYCQNKSLICFSLHRKKRHLNFVQIYNIYIYVYKVFFLYTNLQIFFTPYINTFKNYKTVRPVLKKKQRKKNNNNQTLGTVKASFKTSLMQLISALSPGTQ